MAKRPIRYVYADDPPMSPEKLRDRWIGRLAEIDIENYRFSKKKLKRKTLKHFEAKNGDCEASYQKACNKLEGAQNSCDYYHYKINCNIERCLL